MAIFKAVILKGSVHIRRDNTTSIKIRITHRGVPDYIPTDLRINPDDFDKKAGLAKSGPNKGFINKEILTRLQEFTTEDIMLGDQRNFMTTREIRDFLLKDKKNDTIDLFQFAETVHLNQDGTREQYRALVRSLKSFAGERLPIAHITLNFLSRYEGYLRRRGVHNGVINYMRTFRALFNRARDFYNDEATGRIRIPQYPFKKYKFPKRKDKSRDHTLTVDEMRRIAGAQTQDPRQAFARDMFMLMFYLIGIETKDLYYLEKPRDGRITYDRYKTGGEFSIKLEPEAIEIINRYPGKRRLLNVSERLQTHKAFTRAINRHLHGERAYKNKPEARGILSKAQIHKPVTTKWARHTWATIARNDCRIPKDDIALCLGHQDQSNRVTDTYIKYDYSIIDQANRQVMDML